MKKKFFRVIAHHLPQCLLLISILTSNVLFPATVIAQEIENTNNVTQEETVPIDTSEDILEEGISTSIYEEEEVVEPLFVFENGIYTVKNVVQGEEYVYPDNNDVRVKFTEVTQEGNLVIKRVELTEEQKELLNTKDNYGWDITSSMSNGTFKYNLTLPNTQGNEDIEVKYTEDNNTYESIDNSNIEIKSNVVTIEGLDHFTIFVVVNPLPNNVNNGGSCTVASINGFCYNTIQAAINAASVGDTIKVAPGKYTENITINKRLKIEGSGSGDTTNDTIIIPSLASTPVVTITTSGTSDSERLVLSNIRVKGTGDNLEGIHISGSGSYITFSNVASVNNGRHGVHLPGSSNNVGYELKISDCVFSNNGGVGFRTGSAAKISGLTITNTHADHNYSAGLYFTGPLTGLNISGGSFDDNYGDPNNSNGVGIYTDYNDGGGINRGFGPSEYKANSIKNTSVSGNSRGIILNILGGSSYLFENITASNNNATSSDSGQGITIGSRDNIAEEIKFSNITAGNNSKSNLWFITHDSSSVSNLSIQNSTLTGSTLSTAGYGLYLYAIGGSTLSNVSITGSTITGNNTGIYLRAGSSTATLSNISIEENSIGNNGTGILTSNNISSGNSAHKNNIVGNTTAGIQNNDTGTVFDATLNWWGASDGPSSIGSGTGDTVSSNVSYREWLCEPYETGWNSINGSCAIREIGFGYGSGINGVDSNPGMCNVYTNDTSLPGNKASQILQFHTLEGAEYYMIQGYKWNGSKWVESGSPYNPGNYTSGFSIDEENNVAIYKTGATNEGIYTYEVNAYSTNDGLIGQSNPIEPTDNFEEACKFIVDRTPPDAPQLISPEEPFYTRGVYFEQKWGIIEGAVKYEYNSCHNNPDEDDGYCNPKYQETFTGKNNTTKIVSAGQPDSHFWWRVRAQDLAGNWSEWSEAWEVIIDNTPAEITITPSRSPDIGQWYSTRPTYSNTFPTFEISTNEESQIEYNWNNTSWNTYSEAIKYEENGRHILYIKATDLAGNTTEKQLNVWQDFSNPEGKFTINDDDNLVRGTLQLNFTNVIDPSGSKEIDRIEIWVDGFEYQGSATKVSEGVYKFDLDTTQFDNGNYTIRPSIFDMAGNRTRPYINITIDNTPPEFSLSGIKYTYMKNGVEQTTVQSRSATNLNKPVFVGDLISTDIASIKVVIKGTEYTTTTINGTKWETIVDNPLNDGSYKVKIIATDFAGNTTTIEKYLFIDTVSPTAIFKHYKDGDVIDEIANPITYVKDINQLSFTAEYSDKIPSSGLFQDSYVIFEAQNDGSFKFDQNGKKAFCSWREEPNLVTGLSGATYSLTDEEEFTNCVETLPDGEYYMAHQVYDRATNKDIPSIYQFRDVLGLHFKVDNTPPVITGLSNMTLIEGTTFPTTGTVTLTETNPDKVYISISDSSDVLFTKEFTVEGSAFSLENSLRQTIEDWKDSPFTTTDLSVLPEGIYTISYYATDKAGNISNTETFDLVIQNNVPVVTITPSATEVTAGTSVVLSASVVGGNESYTYAWSGACSGSLATTTFNTDTPDTYTCTVTVTDADGDTAINSIDITVGAVLGTKDETTTSSSTTTPTKPTTTKTNVSTYALGIGSGKDTLEQGEEILETTSIEEPSVLGERCENKKKVSGYVYIDKNKDKEMNENEEGLKDITLTIQYTDEEGNIKTEEEVNTDEKGYWETQLCSGKYNIVVKEDTLPKNIEVSEVLSLTVSDNEEETIFNIQALDTRNFWQKYWYLIVGGLAIIAIGYTSIKNRKKEEI